MSRGPNPGRPRPAPLIFTSERPRMSVVMADCSQALSIAGDFAVRSKLELTNRFAGPSEPGRGSTGKANSGLPTKLPNASGVVDRLAGLKPLPRLFVAVVSVVVLSLAPFPWNRLFLRLTRLGVAETIARPLRAFDWSWFCQKMLLAT